MLVALNRGDESLRNELMILDIISSKQRKHQDPVNDQAVRSCSAGLAKHKTVTSNDRGIAIVSTSRNGKTDDVLRGLP